MTTEVNGIAGLKELVGTHLGYSDWLEITQERVNTFADATGDHQWIHVDPERATAESPFGGPIAHGYLTLSLGPVLIDKVRVFGAAAALVVTAALFAFFRYTLTGTAIRARRGSS